MLKKIVVKGARTHNLKNIEVELPKDQLTVITGLSGSGKSSLAFDTLYAEGQRRYVESLSTYARQFLSVMEKPDVDYIEGLSPAISIEQKSTSHNPRSTVGTITEIYDYLRLLFARVGQPKCPVHNVTLEAQTISQIVDHILELEENTKIMLLAPVVQSKKGEHKHIIEELIASGFIRAKIDGSILELEEIEKLDKNKKHDIEVVVDRLKIKDDISVRLADSISTCLELSNNLIKIENMDTNEEMLFSTKFACPKCDYNLPELEPKIFSFNNPAGACPSCDGIGIKEFIDEKKVIFDETLSLENGAIRNLDRHNLYYFGMITSLSEHYGFSLSTPFKKLPAKIKKIILYGSGREKIEFHHPKENGDYTVRLSTFEGIIPNMDRRYRETDSDYVRNEISKYINQQECPDCNGTRIKESSRSVFIGNKSLPDVTKMSIEQAYDFFNIITFKGWRKKVAEKILKEISTRLSFLVNVGLNYLSLERSANTLSGGEAQRIRLASQIGAGLVGVMYVLDEPSIGLHQRDNDRLLKTLNHLKDLGNTVIVVEHDQDAIMNADYLIDIGPGAGKNGGQVVAKGTPQQVMKSRTSLTGKYLSGKKQIQVPKRRHKVDTSKLISLKKASGNNLKNVNVNIPIGLITCVTGVSGSGKSTLINDTLYPITAQSLNGSKTKKAAPYESISGLEHLDKVVDIDQSPIGRTPRSNAATYTGVFTEIRDLFASTEESISRGYKPGRFSFNVKGGRCEACRGDGLIKVEMHFLPDIYVPCDVCKGKRYNRETLEVRYKGKNIHEVLSMNAEEALEFFKAIPAIAKKLQTMIDVGLSYLCLGQSATTLSGGEAQRIKLAKELSRRDTGRTLYILDEPTTGLHFEDINNLLQILKYLQERGNTIVIIEHNLDVIKIADWIIDLGPEGGDGGGTIIAEATPEELCKVKESHTGKFLKSYL